jgi:hypothetical protein
MASFAGKSWSEIDGDASGADAWRIFKSIIFSGGATWGMIRQRIWWLFVRVAIKKLIDKDTLLECSPLKPDTSLR